MWTFYNSKKLKYLIEVAWLGDAGIYQIVLMADFSHLLETCQTEKN